jgi:hypothetical protein
MRQGSKEKASNLKQRSQRLPEAISVRMSKQRRLTVRLAVIGMAFTSVFFAYLAFTDTDARNETVLRILGVLCPPSPLSVVLIDVEKGSSPAAIVWLIIGLVNSGLYAAIGWVVGRYLWKSNRSTAG